MPFIWRDKRNAGHVLRGRAGAFTDRYVKIRIDHVLYSAHRLAWLYVYGEWPLDQIDHINNDKTDNRICNLRLATQSENIVNRRAQSNNSSGRKGVTRSGKRWSASIRSNGHRYHLGTFDTVDDAHAAYSEAACRLHGEFANVGSKCQP